MITLTKNGLHKKVSTGFSWKFLLFGVLYTASRGDFKGLFIQWVIISLTGGLAMFVLPFTYNKAYLNRLIEGGWIDKMEGI